MADPARAKKIADRIKVIVAETLEFRVKDERLGFVTITDVRVTGDLQNASVFYTVFGGEEERAETAAALESAKGKLRAEVGKGIGIRLTPTLEFFADALPDTAAHMEALLREAKERDAAVAAAASGAVYAGESDPYRKPVDELDAGRRGDRGQPWSPSGPPPVRRRAGRGREGPMTAADRSVASDGLLVVDKPAGWTSHDVVAKARGLCGTRRVGHAGTLDPMATGVLVLGVNRATKLLTFLVGCDKTYTATIRLGQSTLTDDAEGEVTAAYDVSSVTSRGRRGGRGRAHRRPAAGAQRGQRDQDRRQALLRAGPRRRGRRPPGPPGHGAPVRRAGVAAWPRPTARTCSTSTSRSRCPPAPTSARWPATSAARSASAAT